MVPPAALPFRILQRATTALLPTIGGIKGLVCRRHLGLSPARAAGCRPGPLGVRPSRERGRCYQFPHKESVHQGSKHQRPLRLSTTQEGVAESYADYQCERWLMSCVHPGVITLPYANRRMSSLPQAVNRFSPSFPPWQKCRLQPRTSTSSSVDYGGCNLHIGMRRCLGQPRHVGVTSEGGLFLG